MDFSSAPEFFFFFLLAAGLIVTVFIVIVATIINRILRGNGDWQSGSGLRGSGNGLAYDPLTDPLNPISPLNPLNPASPLYPQNPSLNFSANAPISTDAGFPGNSSPTPSSDTGGTWSGGTGFDTGSSAPSSDTGGTWSGGGGFDAGAGSSTPSTGP